MESFFLTINAWMTGAPAWAALGCFLWGMVSVLFSPCHLASIPLIVAYVGGQQRLLEPREAGGYAAAFTAGLFITIAVIGIICALLGRMLGDVGNYWQVLVGIVLVWVAFGMMRTDSCSTSGGLLQRLKLRGMGGAFLLGLAYGFLSGSCTFGFIAPKGAVRVVTAARVIAFRQSTYPLWAKPMTEKRAVMPFRSRLSGWTWWTRSGRKKARNGTAEKATPSPSIPEANDRTPRPTIMMTMVFMFRRSYPPQNGLPMK